MNQIIGNFIYSDQWNQGKLVEVNQLDVAPDGYWGVRCGEGNHWVARTPVDPSTQTFHRDNFNCPSGHRRDNRNSGLAVLREDVPLLEDSNYLFARKWYHASRDKNLQLDGSKLIHLGSREASLHVVIRHQHSNPFYLHEVSLDPQASVSKKLILEFAPGETIEKTHGIRASSLKEVTRYVNVQEAPGSVSLLATTGSIDNMKLIESFPQR